MVTFKAFKDQFVSDAVANHPPAFPVLVDPKETPRKTGWKDPDGVKRQPTPSDAGTRLTKGDFSGAQGLLDFVIAMPALADQLKREGRIRDAGIVLELYRQILDGRQSITDALAILRQNAIP